MTSSSYQALGMTIFLAQPSLESQVGYLRFRFSKIRFKLFIHGLALSYQKDSFFFYHHFTLNFGILTIWFFYLTNKAQTNPRLNLINVPALNYLLRSKIFVNDDGQLRAAHLILDYEPISRTFLDVGNSIRANDYRLAHIDVSRPSFLAPHNLPPVDHPVPKGIPLAAQPLWQVPLIQAVAEEGAASSSSLEKEIDKFRFEEEAIIISEAKEEADEYSCVQTPAPIITYVGDSSDNEEEEMAPKTGPSLRELMKGRNKAPSPQEKSKSKPPVNPSPPPQLPADLGLKPNPDLRRKRYTKALKEGEVGPSKGSKQQRQS